MVFWNDNDEYEVDLEFWEGLEFFCKDMKKELSDVHEDLNGGGMFFNLESLPAIGGTL